MILGPSPAHPRELLHAWLDGATSAEEAAACGASVAFVRPPREAAESSVAHDPSASPCALLEHGLVPIAKELVLDDGVQIDLLARDASQAPVAVLAFDPADEDTALERVVDLDCWYEHGRELLRQALALLAPAGTSPSLRLDAPLRVFVVTREPSPMLLARLRRLPGVDLQVFELRTLRVAGLRRTMLLGVPPWDGGVRTRLAQELPMGLADDTQRGCYEALVQRLALLPGELEIVGDRYWRLLRSGGRDVLELQVQAGVLWAALARAAGGDGRPLSLRGRSDVDLLVDLVLRQVLAAEGPSRVRSSALAGEDEAAQPAPEPGPEDAAPAETLRLTPHTPQAPHVPHRRSPGLRRGYAPYR